MLALLAAIAAPTLAEVDARAPAPPPAATRFVPGTARAPDGTTLGVNNRYLTLDGRPWLPVMGEVHFTRLPRAEWDGALARIKASGVDIVATYLFWNHHEPRADAFDFTGDRDLRHFVERAAAHGLKVVVRLGPWVHAESRFGGIPDWVVRAYPLRGSDPGYMARVDLYWARVAAELRGLLWKDGGPIVGVQIENEYNLDGPGQGRGHIADLKALALRHGLDVPLYTVTGWDQTIYPRGQVLPVFGGYPDEPWTTSLTRLPPKEVYAFRFDSRVSGNLGAQTQGKAGDADPDMPDTPFLGAEYGGGVPTMYQRRPVIAPDDIAAMLPVQLGSGVNLYGYYMYHGGRNLTDQTGLDEATALGGYNDVPLVDYDFQAPFGEYGQANPVAAYVRPFHYLLRSYGAQLAPMTVRKPATVPARADDLSTLRWSVRAAGDAAFLFVSNHVRQYAMAPHADTRFAVALPGGIVRLPPVTIRDGAYFVWPIGLDLGGQRLDWATAQPVTRVDGRDGPVHVFAATDGIAADFAFPAGTRVTGARVRREQGRTIARATPGSGTLLTATRPGQPTVRLVVLAQAQARALWRVELGGTTRLLLTDAQVAGDGANLALTSSDPRFRFALWPALPAAAQGSLKLSSAGRTGLFARYTAQAPARTLKVAFTPLRAAGNAPPVPVGGVARRAMQPWPEAFANAAAAWSLTVPPAALEGLADATLRLDWAGDIGRLYAGPTLLDDRFYDGRTWAIGLRRHAAALRAPLTLRILPLRADAPVYIDPALRLAIPAGGQVAELRGATIEPLYRLDVTTGTR